MSLVTQHEEVAQSFVVDLVTVIIVVNLVTIIIVVDLVKVIIVVFI